MEHIVDQHGFQVCLSSEQSFTNDTTEVNHHNDQHTHNNHDRYNSRYYTQLHPSAFNGRRSVLWWCRIRTSELLNDCVGCVRCRGGCGVVDEVFSFEERHDTSFSSSEMHENRWVQERFLLINYNLFEQLFVHFKYYCSFCVSYYILEVILHEIFSGYRHLAIRLIDI